MTRGYSSSWIDTVGSNECGNSDSILGSSAVVDQHGKSRIAGLDERLLGWPTSELDNGAALWTQGAATATGTSGGAWTERDLRGTAQHSTAKACRKRVEWLNE